jgi:alpha-L-fucosidase
MFIHWGLYAVPAGEWGGQKNHGEWIQYSAGIPGPEYVKLAAQFNPIRFDAKEWVSLAKEAGMKYMVITAKHHEGFAMYDSQLTNYDIVDATPYGRDPMKELAEECRRQGITLCFYYSVKDWHHPEYPTLYTRREKQHPDGFHGFPNPEADYQKYFDYLQGQVRELLTNYGPIGIIWFDWYGDAFEKESEVQRAEEVVSMIHELQPQCLINNRFGAGADYGTPEQQIPGGRQATAFEVCMTMNRHWGYNKNDDDWKDARTIVFNLCDIASKGGNYLLNVGPTAEGRFPEESVRILREVGRWTKSNGESVYGVSPGPDMRWEANIDMVTRRPDKDYLHVFDWPKDGQIFYQYPFYKFDRGLKKAYLLVDETRSPLAVQQFRRSVKIDVPSAAPDPINSVVVVEYERSG